MESKYFDYQLNFINLISNCVLKLLDFIAYQLKIITKNALKIDKKSIPWIYPPPRFSSLTQISLSDRGLKFSHYKISSQNLRIFRRILCWMARWNAVHLGIVVGVVEKHQRKSFRGFCAIFGHHSVRSAYPSIVRPKRHKVTDVNHKVAFWYLNINPLALSILDLQSRGSRV